MSVSYDKELENEYNSKYQDFKNSFNSVYNSLSTTAEQLMSYGWKGNSSKDFYNNLSNYFEQMDGSMNAISSQLSLLDEAAIAAIDEIDTTARQTM